jgi:hypothetical protein
VGVTQVRERIWLVTFMQYDLGYFDDETCRLCEHPEDAAFSSELATIAAPDSQPLPPWQSSRRLAPGLERC